MVNLREIEEFLYICLCYIDHHIITLYSDYIIILIIWGSSRSNVRHEFIPFVIVYLVYSLLYAVTYYTLLYNKVFIFQNISTTTIWIHSSSLLEIFKKYVWAADFIVDCC